MRARICHRGRIILEACVIVLLLAGLVQSQTQEAPALSSGWCRYDRLTPVTTVSPEATSQPVQTHFLAVYYVIPSDLTYEDSVHQRLVEATLDVLAWYQAATGGITWELAYPEIVRVYNALQTHLYYKTNGDWWGSLPSEMNSQGLPIWEPGIVTAILARGAGWWAGGAQSCGVNCGQIILGIEVFPEFNDPAYSGGTCPGGTGVNAWPCTPDGAYAHELGHTLGLPHPVDVPATSPWANHSIMQTHWNYPVYAPPIQSPWGFLSLERQALWANPFMQTGIQLVPTHDEADVVNLPVLGAAPAIAFSVSTDTTEITISNTTTGAAYHYWTFGDGHVSWDSDPIHSYDTPGNYTVRLRATAADAMMSVASQDITVPVCPILNTGDVDLSLSLTSADIIYLVNFVFKGGAPPLPCEAAGDVDCAGSVDAGDIVYMVSHVFKGGTLPCDVCTLWPATWDCS